MPLFKRYLSISLFFLLEVFYLFAIVKNKKALIIPVFYLLVHHGFMLTV